MEADLYSSDILSKSFLKKYSSKKVPWRNSLGYIVYKRTYSRLKENGNTEEWWETIARCINGLQSIGAKYTIEEAEKLFDAVFNFKCCFSGRSLWQLGTPLVEDLKIGDSVLNCWATKSSEINDFTFILMESMFGGGVGINIAKEYSQELPRVKRDVKCRLKNTKDADFIVPDSKEGWVNLWEWVLKSYLITGESFTYSTVCIRPHGEPLKTFGGIAPGPKPLIDGTAELCKVLEKRAGKKLRTDDVADIICIGGEMIKSGGIRRTALILGGDVDDQAYVRLKRWDLGEIPNYRANSNNSILCKWYDHLQNSFWEGYSGNGEPYGLVNLKNARAYGRLGEEKWGDFSLKEPDIIMCNPCAEAMLEDKEPCVAGDTHLITKDGIHQIQDVVGKPVEIWNGEKWSTVTPRVTGKNKKLYRVQFNDGSYLDCTGNHNFSVTNRFQKEYSKVKACDLENFGHWKIHTEPFQIDYPETSGTPYGKDAYTLGYTVGDGHIDGNLAKVVLFGEKDFQCPVKGHELKFSPMVNGKPKYAVKTRKLNVTDYVDVSLVSRLKSDVSALEELFSWDKESILQFIAGLADADGSNTSSGGIRIYFSVYERVQLLQLLLTKVGIKSSICLCSKKGTKTNFATRNKDLYYLQITECNEIPCHRLKVSNGHKAKCKGKWQIVKSVTELEDTHTVYCFEEAEKHMAVFGNTLTYQCNLAELVLPNLDSKEEMLSCAKLLYKGQKAICAMNYYHEDTNKVVHRNYKIGMSVTGVCQRIDVFKPWCEHTYRGLREFDKKWSKEQGYKPSIRLTVVQPSGTKSLMFGVTPGAHTGYSKYYIRRVRFDAKDHLLDKIKEAGYHVEPEIRFDGTPNHRLLIASFPCAYPDETIFAENFSAIQQLNLLKDLQTVWADQAVSITVYYKKEELPAIKEWLKENYDRNVKSVSFLLHSDHGFKQAPFEEITEEKYKKELAKVKTLDKFENGYSEELFNDIECAGGACPIR